MESAQQQPYYSFLERMRRQAIIKESLMNVHNIAVRKHFIASGQDPREDEDILKEFWILINECGTDIFADELAGLNLTIEDG